MAPRLDDKRVLITGAAGGLGRAMAETFVERGARVVLADLDGAGAERLAGELGEAARAVRCDVTSPADLQAAFDAAVAELGGLDVLVNNAGIEIGKPVVETGLEEFERLMAINVKGVFLGMKLGAPVLAASGGGTILNMSSVAGLGGTPLLGVYCASKAAVLRLTETAAVELRGIGVRVNALCPAFIDTAMVDRLVEPVEAMTGMDFGDIVAAKQGRLGTPQDVAEMAVFLASEESEWVNGSHYVVDGALTAGLL